MKLKTKEEEKADLTRMTLQRLEELVGRKPVDVWVEGKIVVAQFSDPEVFVKFKQW